MSASVSSKEYFFSLAITPLLDYSIYLKFSLLLTKDFFFLAESGRLQQTEWNGVPLL